MAKNTVIVSITANTKSLKKGLGDSEGMLSKLGGVAKGASKVVAGVGVALVGLAAAGGFARSLKLDEAKTQLNALGYSGQQVEGIMDSALKSVKGTAFGLDSAATIAANALASGIKPGDDLTRSLTLVANTAALAKVDMGEMGGVFQKVWANGKVTTQEMNQLADKGVPIWQYLSEAFGVSNEELREMVKRGEVTAEMFEGALGPAVEGMAGAMSGSFKGMLSNANAALSRLGAMFAGPLLELGKKGLGEFTKLIDGIAEMFKPAADGFAAFVDGITLDGLADKILGFLDGLQGLSPTEILLKLATGLADGIVNMAPKVAAGIGNVLVGIVDALVSGLPAILAAASILLKGIIDAVPLLIPPLIATLTELLPVLVETLVGMVPAILAAAVTLLTAIVQAIPQIVPPLIEALVGLLPRIAATLIEMIPVILEAAILLFTALVESIPVILPILIAAIVDLLPVLVTTLLEMIPVILETAIELFMALVESIPVILPQLLEAIIAMLPTIVSSVLSMLPRLLEAAVQLFVALVTAVPKILPKLIPAIIDLLPKMISAIIGMIPDLITAGIDLIGGLIKGIGQAAGAVGEALINIAKSAIGGFLSFLGIKSPSRLFMGFGKNTVQGLVGGITGSFGLLDNAMDGLSSRVSGGFDASLTAPNIGVTSAGAHGTGNTYNVTVEALHPTAETGRVIIESIRDYEDAGGRL